MKPIEFDEMNGVAAEDQPEYLPLPLYRAGNRVISCWKMTWFDRLTTLFTGKIWMTLLHFDKPISPSKLETKSPFKKR